MRSPRPSAPRRIWLAFAAVVLLALVWSGVAVLILVLADGHLSASFVRAPRRSIGPNPPLWVGFAFAAVFACSTWAYATFLLREALRRSAERVGA